MDWLDMEEPLRIGGYPLRQILAADADRMAAGQSTTNQDSSFWYEIGVDATTPFARRIAVYPAPARAATLKYNYLRAPLTLATVGNTLQYPDLPLDFHQAPCYYAAWQFYARKQESTSKDLASYYQIFDAAKTRLRMVANERMRPTFRGEVPDYLSQASEAWMEV